MESEVRGTPANAHGSRASRVPLCSPGLSQSSWLCNQDASSASLLPYCAARIHLLVWFCSFLVNNLHSFVLAQFAKIEQTVQFSVIMPVQDRSKVWLREALSELKRHLVEMEHEKKMKICLNWLWPKWERIEHNSANTSTKLKVFVFLPLL